MKKPIKDYKNMYNETNKKNPNKTETFYMCEYIDAWIKKPGETNSQTTLEVE